MTFPKSFTIKLPFFFSIFKFSKVAQVEETNVKSLYHSSLLFKFLEELYKNSKKIIEKFF